VTFEDLEPMEPEFIGNRPRANAVCDLEAMVAQSDARTWGGAAVEADTDVDFSECASSARRRCVTFEEPESEKPEFIGNRRRAHSVCDLEAMIAESDARAQGVAAVEADADMDLSVSATSARRRRVTFEEPEAKDEKPEFIGNRRRAHAVCDLEAMVAESEARMSVLRG